MLTISKNEQSGYLVYTIDGRVDTDGARQMESTFREALASGYYMFVLDLAKTNYLNSAGLRILADVLTQCRNNDGDCRLAAPNTKVTRVLEIIGFDKFFNVYASVDAALADN
jgi:anti-sigma B factor antagonist